MRIREGEKRRAHLLTRGVGLWAGWHTIIQIIGGHIHIGEARGGDLGLFGSVWARESYLYRGDSWDGES